MTVQALSKQKKKESPARTPRETIRFYATFSFSLIAISGFSVLMFLVPFIVDPALATLTADFVEKPVECRVIFSRAILGSKNSAVKLSIGSTTGCTITPTSAFTFKTLLRHYAKQALTPQSLNMKS